MELAEVKQCMDEKTVVTHGGIPYTLEACVLRLGPEGFFYQVELRDLKANSVTIARLKDVEKVRNEG